ncbi:sigma-70 family RNA polymerase sigma factor [Thermoactinomyces daqus]|uniref:Sigma-70 family RNA polymerase sigma factor n=1 Tax=Thermoactinomyces daqus TaxID=1329516 RepID=A0A7W2AGT4_9BACL|nr:sigma-70 family RNA polymerase sigma factor [Thermoactinomyces daqus]MBA4541966.1 sigma-70 family RNA polymerase sigma factor [Thermoactinomyces daqus]
MTEQQKQMIVENMNLVPFVLHKFYPSFRHSSEYEDIMGCGYLGLTRAALKYNGKFKFSTFAVYHIRSEISAYLKRRRAIKRQADVVSLDAPVDFLEEEGNLHAVIGHSSPDILNAEVKLIVRGLLSSAGERERAILKMHFFDGLTAEEIGKRFNLSRARIQQIIKKELNRLNRRLRTQRIKKSDLIA